MANLKKQVPMDSQQLLAAWLFALGALILLASIFGWYQYLHRSTYGVFWDSIDNNLNSSGVTRTVTQSGEGTDVTQRLQLSLGAENAARGIKTITQKDASGAETKVVTEVIGTPSSNFVRYTDITTASNPPLSSSDTDSVKNIWARETLTEGQQLTQGVFSEGVFGGAIPIGDLTQPQRQEILDYMKQSNLYKVDFDSVQEVTRGGKQGFEYRVEVDIKSHITMLKMLDKMLGLNQMSQVSPEAYDGQPAANITVVSSITGRQLLEVNYTGTSRNEAYSAYGAHIQIALPETTILQSELELKVQDIFKSSSGS